MCISIHVIRYEKVLCWLSTYHNPSTLPCVGTEFENREQRLLTYFNSTTFLELHEIYTTTAI